MNKTMYKNIMVLLGLAVLVLGLMLFAQFVPSEHSLAETITYDKDWYYIQNNKKIPISLPADVQLVDEDSVTIYNDSIVSGHAGMYVYVKNAIYRPQIYLNDDLIYSYDDGGLRRNPPELSYQICKGKIKDHIEAGILKITYHKSNGDTISLPKVLIGTGDSIIRNLFLTNAYTTVITITMIMLGIFSLILGVSTIGQNYANNRKLLMLGLFLFITGTWCATDSPLLQYLLDYSNLNMTIDFFVFMFLVIPFVGYIKGIHGMEKYKSLNYIIIASVLNIVVQTSLALLHRFTLVELVPISHILIVIGAVTSIALLYIEYKRFKGQEILLCLRAFSSAGIFGVVSIGIYFLKPELYYQNLFQTGLLLFVLILMWNIVSEFIESLQYKVEAKVYKKLAEVDKLTNLFNRRIFDVKIREIEEHAEAYDNVLLIFIDMNGLKWVNDSYGHTKGDETVAAVARCIERAYKRQSSCYRIGGDEFCVIVENPLFSEQDAVRFIEHELEIYQKTSVDEFRFTVAVGCSLLKEHGAVKDIAKWKEEADCKMYEDKKKKKYDVPPSAGT